jgi:hypothetical protein
MAKVPAKGDAVLYIGTPVTARGSGLGSFCAACDFALCSGTRSGRIGSSPPTSSGMPTHRRSSSRAVRTAERRPVAATSRDLRPAVLFGADASASAPASLPTAWGLIRAYCERLEEALRGVPDLAARVPPLEDWIRGLRFEQIVSMFNRIGLALDAIAPLDSSRTPNENHRLLASLYCAGWPLLTTNFDVLTEIASNADTPPAWPATWPKDAAVRGGWHGRAAATVGRMVGRHADRLRGCADALG